METIRAGSIGVDHELDSPYGGPPSQSPTVPSGMLEDIVRYSDMSDRVAMS